MDLLIILIVVFLIRAAWARVRARIKGANALWEQAGAGKGEI